MHRTLSALLGIAFLAGAAPVADAQSARQARQQVEASMLVTGHVDIDRTGRVTAHVLDQPDKLPPYVVSAIERAMPSLRFEPILVDDEPVLARAKMSVRLVMSRADEGEMHLRIASAHFGEPDTQGDTSAVRSAAMAPPRYPTAVALAGGQGTVYLLVKVGRDGSTLDAHAEQVNLTALGSARQMETIRTELAKAAVSQARRQWTWTPPTTGEQADRDYWVVRVPVSFELSDGFQRPSSPYGQWLAYHPGERSRPEWSARTQPGFRPDALAAGDATPETSRFKLLTSFEG